MENDLGTTYKNKTERGHPKQGVNNDSAQVYWPKSININSFFWKLAMDKWQTLMEANLGQFKPEPSENR